jgi:uncharacterized protein (DUF1015 family)
MRTCRANLSQVYALHGDGDGAVRAALERGCAAAAPVADFTDEAGVRHVLRAVTDPVPVTELAQRMADRPLFIADGHHRYETALGLRDGLRRPEAAPGTDPADYLSILCVAMEDEGLVVLSTHRVLRRPVDPRALLDRLEYGFRVRRLDAGSAAEALTALEAEAAPGAVAAYLGGTYWLLKVRSWDELDARCGGHCEAWRRLDVSVLHALVLEKELGIPFGPGQTGEVTFTQDAAGAAREVDSRRAGAAFLVRAAGVGALRSVAEAGDRMPPKSTYFWPKPVSGLVVNVLEGEPSPAGGAGT